MSEYRKAAAAAATLIGVVIAGMFPDVDGLAEAIAAVGLVAVYWLPNAPADPE